MKIWFVKQQRLFFLICKWHSDAYRPLPCWSLSGTWPGICKSRTAMKVWSEFSGLLKELVLIQGKKKKAEQLSGAGQLWEHIIPCHSANTHIHTLVCFKRLKYISPTGNYIYKLQFIPGSGLPPAVCWPELLYTTLSHYFFFVLVHRLINKVMQLHKRLKWYLICTDTSFYTLAGMEKRKKKI